MKLTKSQLKQIIKEELGKVLSEADVIQFPGPRAGSAVPGDDGAEVFALAPEYRRSNRVGFGFEKEEGYLTLAQAATESQKDRHPIDRYYPHGDYVEARKAGYTESEAFEYAVDRVPPAAREWMGLQ